MKSALFKEAQALQGQAIDHGVGLLDGRVFGTYHCRKTHAPVAAELAGEQRLDIGGAGGGGGRED